MDASARRVAIAVLTVAVLCTPAASARADEKADARAVEKKLAQKIAKLDFTDIEFKDVLAFLRDVSGINIQVRWKALQVAGIDQTTSITVHLTNIPLRRAVEVLVGDLGSGGTPLAFEVEGNVLTISTLEDLSRHTLTRTYDVNDLIEAMADHEYESEIRPPTWDEKPLLPQSFYEDEDRRAGDFIQPPPRRQNIEDLQSWIREAVAPTTWRAAGGDVASLCEAKGHLIITQTLNNHKAIEALLNELREALVRGPMVTVSARWVALPADKGDKLLAGGVKEVTPTMLAAAGAKTKYTVKACGFSGRAFHAAAGPVKSYVTNVEPVVAEKAAAYRPIVQKLLLGAALAVRPTLCPGRDEAVLSIRSVVGEPKAPEAPPVQVVLRADTEKASSPVRSLDRLDLLVHTLRSTVRVRLGKATLIGAMTAAGAKGGELLCLIVEVTATPREESDDKAAAVKNSAPKK